MGTALNPQPCEATGTWHPGGFLIAGQQLLCLGPPRTPCSGPGPWGLGKGHPAWLLWALPLPQPCLWILMVLTVTEPRLQRAWFLAGCSRHSFPSHELDLVLSPLPGGICGGEMYPHKHSCPKAGLPSCLAVLLPQPSMVDIGRSTGTLCL